ncbi:MAG: beta-lactamase family protein [Calditrichaeota bacterium]|nr:beta-lactamase family protein [Calditrichota bacterium]
MDCRDWWMLSKAWLSVALAGAFFACGCANTKLRQVDEFFRAYSGQVPGAAVMVIHKGHPIVTRCYGLANLEQRQPVRECTNFRLASVSKQFTAMCIMILAERGLLRYDQTLREIFPAFPPYGDAVTIDHLLHHTSGLIDYESLLPDTMRWQVSDADVLRMMMEQDSTYFPPGSQFRYSNSGYAVLAMVVEKVSRKRFADFLRENVFIPAGMTSTIAYEKNGPPVLCRSYGYQVLAEGGFVFRDQSPTSAVLGDGGIYSSLRDLLRWDQALYDERLVSFETLERAFTPGLLNDGTSTAYGHGWRLDVYRGRRRMHHTGSTCGFATLIQRYPDDRFSVIVLTNRNEPSLMAVGDRLTELFLP